MGKKSGTWMIMKDGSQNQSKEVKIVSNNRQLGVVPLSPQPNSKIISLSGQTKVKSIKIQKKHMSRCIVKTPYPWLTFMYLSWLPSPARLGNRAPVLCSAWFWLAKPAMSVRMFGMTSATP